MDYQGLERIDLTSIILEPSSPYRGFFTKEEEGNNKSTTTPILCQIVSMDDISRSGMELVDAIDSEVESRTANNNPHEQVIYFVPETTQDDTSTKKKKSILDSPTCLKLTLQDLYGNLVYAVLPINNNNRQSTTTLMLPRLSTTFLGAKLLIYGHAEFKHKILFLDQDSVALLSHTGIPDWNKQDNIVNDQVARLKCLRSMILKARNLNR